MVQVHVGDTTAAADVDDDWDHFGIIITCNKLLYESGRKESTENCWTN